jgi:alpha-D-ribose 1-methylphosphonate 5-triphosphate synthase subunit PhnL
MDNLEALLEVRGLEKHFRLHAQGTTIPSASPVSFVLPAASLTTLTGPTGAGKSSVLKAIYRTYLPSAGNILFCTRAGQRVDLASAAEPVILALRLTEIAMVTQFLHVVPRRETLDVVAQPLYDQGVPREAGRAKAAAILAELALPERLWTLPPATFSGGERQRVNLARGFIAEPRLLLLDEPTASLDPVASKLVVALIQRARAAGAGILAIFHDPALVDRLADQQIVVGPPVPMAQVV